ncbi:WecB/TagA/CpsF family glycosyltransferase [Lysobacter sp. KIS68-7]|uniref:WecB/TagA/CpsF family glycosyltransferase n=1 Tax=Lysobacter sp. KIS68-7 TaxID=2904252 RepID=UPI001E4D5338|nr:WecB/TagA/CpsF family glycosyltransferase [Lysobacter sp. KIS68-7]UHQ18463.1 WecB/TagA/CpsF family glycosyltransferase [Lysobacter sp. KIS68-7]
MNDHPSWHPLPHVSIAGWRIAIASRRELAEAAVSDAIAARACADVRPRLVFDANGHGLSMHATDAGFKASIDAADVVHADGGFLVTASRFLCKTPIAERSATTDLIHDIAEVASQQGVSFYLLGGTEDANRQCAELLAQRYPHLVIAGRRNGYFKDGDVDQIIADINASGAGVLWVGLGKPLEQRFCVENRKRLRVAWALTCGGCFNYITGDYPRAPMWMQRANLEWMHRMATNPRKLFMRYLLTTPHALWLLSKDVFKRALPT